MTAGGAAMATYGYSPSVGEWTGSIALAEAERAPLPAMRRVLGELRAIFEATHRVAQAQVSWVEYGDGGEELAFHELEDHAVASWGEAAARLEALAAGTPHRFAVQALFLELAVRIEEPAGEVWLPRAGELQLSIGEPELAPSSVEVGYTTHTDAWLAATYDEGYRPRDNRAIAAANRPALEAALRALHALAGASYRAERSRLYPFALAEHGFTDEHELPPRG